MAQIRQGTLHEMMSKISVVRLRPSLSVIAPLIIVQKTWKANPTLVIKPLSNFQCGVKAAYGCFRPSKPNQIELAESDAKIFETDAYGAGIDKNSKGKGLFIVGATILHELCHWGNHKHSVNEKTEQGLAFERATYGKTIG